MNPDFWLDRPVLVTGATGLLGSTLVRRLVDLRAIPVCLVRDWVGRSRFNNEEFDRSTVVVRGQLEDFELLLRTVNEYEIDTVLHVGAQTIVGTAARSPLSTFESNIRGTWNLLEACRLCPRTISRIVIASSDKAYGEHSKLPYTEQFPLHAHYPYDVSKACADLIGISYFRTYGLPVAVTRCGNLYGGGDLNFNRLVPGTIRSVLRDEAPLIRSDGTYIRDYFYVEDAVEAYLHLAESLPREGVVGEVFNFGNETPVSVLEMVGLILEATGKTKLTPKVLGEASNEILSQYLDCGKAHSVLKWQPRYTMQEGLEATVAWYREHLSSTQ